METTTISEQQNQRKLDRPTNLTFVEASENTITISWCAVANAKSYLILCKDVVQNDWNNCNSTLLDDGATTAIIQELYPTATFEIRVIASNQQDGFEDSEESESLFADTLVGSCAPKEKKRCCCIM